MSKEFPRLDGRGFATVLTLHRDQMRHFGEKVVPHDASFQPAIGDAAGSEAAGNDATVQ